MLQNRVEYYKIYNNQENWRCLNVKQKLGCLVTVLTVFVIPLMLIFVIIPMQFMKFDGTWRVTENLAEYGVIKDNCDNEWPEKFLMGFFPEKIEPYFENVVYKYKAFDWCDYNCEMYLEFTIADPEQFHSYVETLTEGLTAQVFPYDVKYDDYIIHNHLYVEPSSSSEPGNERYYFRFGARMGRILVCEEEQRIICQGILIRGCCGGYAEDYDFYDRFGIDPQEYSDRFCDDDEYE